MLNIPLNQDYNFIAGMTSVLPSYSHSKNEHYLIAHDKVVKCVCELCSCGTPLTTQGNIDVPGSRSKDSSILPMPSIIRISQYCPHPNCPASLRPSSRNGTITLRRFAVTIKRHMWNGRGEMMVEKGDLHRDWRMWAYFTLDVEGDLKIRPFCCQYLV